MARRIALTVIALVAVLLGTIAIPLGLHAANDDRADFEQQAMATATTVANVAEEHLADGDGSTAVTQAVHEVKRHGDQVAVYAGNGRLVAGDRSVTGITTEQVRRALAGHTTLIDRADDRVIVVTPIFRDGKSASVGAVAFTRSTGVLDHRTAALWTWLALISAAGLAAAALIATGLARWVSKPLGGLEAAAQRLGAGQLDSRAPASDGPPEVRRLAANFNQMAGRLEGLVSGHQAMMADVSHQLRTPLAALRLRLDVLGLAAHSQVADELAGAQDEIARLSRMVDGLLAVARAENVTSPAVSVPVGTIISERFAAWLPAADEKPVRLEAESTGALYARLGEGHLEQMLDNLLANALEAVPAGGRIKVTATAADGLVRVIVADDGPGMSSQQKRAALRRYVTATPGGTGLGLAIVHRLVTADGGSIALSDTQGGGLTVTLDLPATIRERQPWRPGTTAATRNLKQF